MNQTKRIFTLTFAALAGAGILFAFFHRSSSTFGQTINATIDDLGAVGIRLMELPVVMLLAGAAVLAAALALPLMRWGTKSGRITLVRVAGGVMAGVILVGLAWVADYKIKNLQIDIIQLREELRQARMVRAEEGAAGGAAASVSNPPKGGTPNGAVMEGRPPKGGTTYVAVGGKRSALLVDTGAIAQKLTPMLGAVKMSPVIHDNATDVVEMDFANGPVVAYMAIVDLKVPGLEIKCGGDLRTKTLTSAFARQNDCQIAINGEAGMSPRANSGLGEWSGNMMSAGAVWLKETARNPRPFLAFDRQSVGRFVPLAAGDRSVWAESYNVIWGRLDAVIEGKVQTENERSRQPRTAMGINAEGSRLYLLVADGRQPRYSVGLLRGEVGQLLQAFGANNGMLCDEGGSSCLWLKKYGRVINSPSDGVERATYTHFGVALKAVP
jgi:hypothetical protein